MDVFRNAPTLFDLAIVSNVFDWTYKETRAKNFYSLQSILFSRLGKSRSTCQQLGNTFHRHGCLNMIENDVFREVINLIQIFSFVRRVTTQKSCSPTSWTTFSVATVAISSWRLNASTTLSRSTFAMESLRPFGTGPESITWFSSLSELNFASLHSLVSEKVFQVLLKTTWPLEMT